MLNAFPHEAIARWFFLLLAAGVIVLFWNILSPFLIVLATAGVAAVVVSPLEKKMRSKIRIPWVSSALTVIFVALVIIVPLTIIGVLMAGQAIDLARETVANQDWLNHFALEEQPVFQKLPEFAQDYLLSLDLSQVVSGIANWASGNVVTVFSGGASLIFKTFIFFICLYFFLLERENIAEELMSLSPFKDSVDKNIMYRLVETVRGVVFGSLIVSTVQGIVAAIGFTIFGVPGALIWAAVVIVASQVPMLGTALVTVPAILYLLFTGHIGAGIGLLIWAVLAVGLVDNFLQPIIVGGKTKMHAFLILLSILGGIDFFGPIGLILGPTVLAAFLVILELYKAGILERRNVA